MYVYLIQHAEKLREPGDPGITELGRAHATLTGAWAQRTGIRRVYCSPLRRSWQTAQVIADAVDVQPVQDGRATERMNWDGTVPFAHFSAEWARTVEDRAYTPSNGDSSHAAASRLLALVREVGMTDSPAAIVTHGGVTVDLLRTLLEDTVIADSLLTTGVPSCAITTLNRTTAASVASVEHLTA
ncbi:histidine phosphatase family protein [Actinospica robiniae]|uniref:histidine phosphatase family protein n=1 Tax=Actinospica robiniae TaxID=304901 RepID=UPI000411D7A8|nr:histidine phosphatase family protein [Actinospica robiniae]